MSTLDAPSSPTRLRLLVVLLAVSAVTLALLAPGSLALVVSQLLLDGPLFLAWLGACHGIGSLLTGWKPIRIPADASTVLSRGTILALGMGVLSVLLLATGSAGLLNQAVAIGLLVAANGPTLLEIYRHQAAIRSYLGTGAGSGPFVLAIAMPIVGATVLGALVVPWILWGDEPHAYDVVAYHFQLPREWLEQGRIAATPYNVFGYFPLNVEMHYLLAMTVRGGATSGMYLAQLMHAGMMILTLFAVYGAIQTEAPRSRLVASVSVVFAAAFPWLLMLGSVGYNECGVMLFTTLALAWALRRQWLVAGLCAGFAAGCKITSVPTLILLLPAIVLLDSLIRKRFEWRGLGLFLVGSVVALSPWLVRTAVLIGGNPVFPIAARTLGSGHFDPGMVERFEVAHAARPDQQSISGRSRALVEQVFRDFKYGSAGVSLLLLLTIPALVIARRDRAAWMLFLFIVGNILVWLFATHLQGRFLVPIIPAAAMLVGAVPWRPWPLIVLGISIGSMPFAFASVCPRLTSTPAQSGIGYPEPMVFLPEKLVELLGSTDRPVYLVGDARAFLYPVSSGRLHYRSVFDVASTRPFREAWLGESPAADAIVVVAPTELERFEKTYRNLPPMPSEWRGRPMFVTDVAFRSFVLVE